MIDSRKAKLTVQLLYSFTAGGSYGLPFKSVQHVSARPLPPARYRDVKVAFTAG